MNFIKRLIFLILSMALLGAGIGIFLSSGLGGDPNSAFVEGVSLYFGISYSWANFILNGILIFIILLIDRRYIHLASILAMVFVGFFAQETMVIIEAFLPLDQLVFYQKMLITILGGMVLSLGIVLYINQKLGVAAFDATSELLAARTKHQYKYIRITMDLIALALAYFFGGTIGIGTIYLSLTTGPQVKLIRTWLGIPSN